MVSNYRVRHFHLSDIERIVRKKLAMISENDLHLLPIFGPSISDAIQDATPLILEVSPYVFRHLVIEKGHVYEDKIVTDVDELIFTLMEPIISSLAFNYAAKQGKNKQQRAVAFVKQMEPLVKIEVEQRFLTSLKIKYKNLLGYDLFWLREG